MAPAVQDEAVFWRCFIAVDVPDPVRVAAARLQAVLRRTDADLSLPDPKNLHLTILFLGLSPVARLDAVRRAMDTAAAEIQPFTLVYQGLGYFGPPRRPRVIWAGVEGDVASLEKIRKRILAEISEPWFTNDQDAFRPHLTLCRIRSGRGLDGLTARVASHREAALGVSVVRRILLMRSHLDRPRPSYSVLHETKLQGA